MKSTSVHCISADFALSVRWQRLWWGLNSLNNRFLPWWAPGLPQQVFRPRLEGPTWDLAFGNKSPTRVLSDLFWTERDWTSIRTRLGALDVLDLGCGSGRYGERIERWSGGPLRRYTGTDLSEQPSWVELCQRYAHFRFFQQPISRVHELLDAQMTMVMSQSAIEHFPHDRALMRTLADWRRARRTPLLQIHLLPARIGLEIFRYHGVRQYTPRTCRMLAAPFLGWTQTTLYGLGGPACTELHAWWLKHVSGQGERRLAEYGERLKEAIAADSAAVSREVGFYALMIESGDGGQGTSNE